MNMDLSATEQVLQRALGDVGREREGRRMGVREAAGVTGQHSSELQRVREERNELKDTVESFEQQLAQVHHPGRTEHTHTTHTHTHTHAHTTHSHSPPSTADSARSGKSDSRQRQFQTPLRAGETPIHIHTVYM